MKQDVRKALHDFTLEARELLLKEASEQLEGIYGLLPSGRFAPASGYPALTTLPEAGETRRRLEKHIADEEAAGLKREAARAKLVKEVAFTWLNRLVAFRMMESRGLLRQSVAKGADSNGFKLWLTEGGNEKELELYNAGSLPQDARGEGPRDTAYRHYLLHLCRKMSEEIRVLFDPQNLPSLLCSRPRVLADVLGAMVGSVPVEAWQDEAAIGWVYQAFNSVELTNAFHEVAGGAKFEASQIPVVTQLFTPRPVVKFLIHNSLGRLWLQIHPDSRLRAKLDYIAPTQEQTDRRPRLAKEITLLDPACGTMHFGLVAFELFAEMYQEELERAEYDWAKRAMDYWPERVREKCKETRPMQLPMDLRSRL